MPSDKYHEAEEIQKRHPSGFPKRHAWDSWDRWDWLVVGIGICVLAFTVFVVFAGMQMNAFCSAHYCTPYSTPFGPQSEHPLGK